MENRIPWTEAFGGGRFLSQRPWFGRLVIGAACLVPVMAGAATNLVAYSALGAGGEPLSGVGTSVIRVLGALGVTLAIFFAGVWLFRNWQRLVARTGRQPALQVLECRALGGRQSLWVVAYEGQRMLLASAPSGVSLIAHLPAMAEQESAMPAPAAAHPVVDFSVAFQHLLGRKP